MWRIAVYGALAGLICSPSVAQPIDGRWAASQYACDADGATRLEAPLLVAGQTLGWFTSVCTVVSSYKVGQAYFLQARCFSEGRTSEIPAMLEPRGAGLRVGWNREPIVELQRCR